MGPRGPEPGLQRSRWGAVGGSSRVGPLCPRPGLAGWRDVGPGGNTVPHPARGWRSVTACAAESSPEKSENLVFAPVQVPPLTAPLPPDLGLAPTLPLPQNSYGHLRFSRKRSRNDRKE